MLGRKLLTAITTVTLAASVYASSSSPVVCPQASAIKNIGLSEAMEIQFNIYVGLEMNTYNTDREWVFVIGPVLAKSRKEALKVTNGMLSGLSGGVYSDGDGYPACLYETGVPDVYAQAVEPTEDMSAHKAAQRLNRYHK